MSLNLCRACSSATRKAVPRSAKAHLNYSVMLGARGDLPGRLESNGTALALAPQWPMASVYMGDTLCRMHRAPEAVPHYERGFSLGPCPCPSEGFVQSSFARHAHG